MGKMKIRFWCAALVVCPVCFVLGGGIGMDSAGNTDGVITWNPGPLKAGKAVTRTVVFAYADSYEQLGDVLGKAQKAVPDAIDVQSIDSIASQGEYVWISNGVTDLGFLGNGSFFWEGVRQSLSSVRGGQLSRFGYYVRYNDGVPRYAGTPVSTRGRLENLRVVEPMRAVGKAHAKGKLETLDGKLRIEIGAAMGESAVGVIRFLLVNQTDQDLEDVSLSVYSNLEAAHDHENDYSVLDAGTGGLLTIDPATGICAVMTGLQRPASGYSGTWASADRLRQGDGVEFAKWDKYDSLPNKYKEQLLRASIPHPPAPYVEPVEPPTQTLTPADAEKALKSDWLFQAEGQDILECARKEIGWAMELAKRIVADGIDLSRELIELNELRERIDTVKSQMDAKAAEDLYFAVREVKRRIVFKNPLVDFSKVLFIDNPYPQGAEWPHQARHRDGMMAVPGGRLLVLDGLHPGGQIRKLAPPEPGSFWKPDISFDGKKVLFCFKPHDEESFHLYETGIDADASVGGIRQLTFGMYDDLDPIYLPDGHIIFSSTRANTYIRCMPYTYCYVLARCDADGKNIYLISRNSETDWVPSLLNDGRVIYSRWEYHDKALWRIQSLWTVNPDGTGTAAFWGNQSVWPDHLAEARPIPASRRIMFTGLAHHDWFAGSIGMIDPDAGFNFPRGLTKVTADVAWPECGEPPSDMPEKNSYHRSGNYTAYKSAYPLSEEDFLVSARRGNRFRLYLMDVYGNRELIYEGAHNIWHAMPVRPRKRPPVLNDRVDWPGTGIARKKTSPGVLFSSNVYQGVPEKLRNKAKYLRVIQMDARTYSSWTRDARFSGPAVSIVQDDGVKRVLGTVPVRVDGSVSFKVPAGKALHFQLLDEHYRALQTMRSFTGVMPGENRGCVGCHEMHSVSPNNRPGMALRDEPAELTPTPWGDESIGYERFVQPVLDKYCGDCHQGNGKGRAKLDLTLRDGFRFFKEPYVTLVGYADYAGLPQDMKRPGIAGALMAENYDQRDAAAYVTSEPMKHLSYNSRLIELAMSTEHYNVKVDPYSLRRLIAWVDANCPYRGDQEIRAIDDPSFAGIEALPIRPRIKTAPVIQRP